MKPWLAILTAAILAAGVGLTPTGCTRTGRGPEAATAPTGRMAGVKQDPYDVLAEAIRSDQPALESLAAETYLESDQPPPAGLLEPLADARDPGVRAMAITVLGTTRRSNLVPLFRQKLRDAAPVVRLAAAYSLALNGDPPQVNALGEGLASQDLAVRRYAAWLLGLKGDSSAVVMLKRKLDDPDAMLVLRVAEALFRLGSRDGLAQVRTLTEHDRHAIRRLAARLLGQMGTTADIPRLEKLCQSRFLDVKLAAIAAVARQGDFKRIELLLDLLDSQEAATPDLNVRALAAWELAETGYTPAIEPLARLMARGDPMERTASAAAIIRIRSARQPWRSHILADRPAPAASDAAPPAPAARPGPLP
jgi:HEAT repeat protein